MPTGYTADIADGKVTTLREFAMRSARGMGALIMMRDDPWDAPIPERFEPHTSYQDEAIAEAQAVLDEVVGLSLEECERRARAEYEAEAARYDGYDADKLVRRERYEAMLAKVEAWTGAPEGLKEFMASQLRESIDFDCTPYRRDFNLKTGSEWRQATLKKAAGKLGRATEDRAKEIARTEGRNAWIATLRASLAENGAANADTSSATDPLREDH